MEELDRITFDKNIMGGRACIRGLRISVSQIVNMMANGMSQTEILREYPFLEADDLRQALQSDDLEVRRNASLAIQRLDAIVQLAVKDRDLTGPPGSPNDAS